MRSRGPLLSLLSGALLGLLLTPGCALHRSWEGLLVPADDGVELQQTDGRQWRISRSGDGSLMPGLVDCEVELEGSRLFRRISVRDWAVSSAPGGGQPFVGRLRLFGSNWLIEDRTTGREVIVDIAVAPELAQHAGKVVLVVGYVVGAQMVRPVTWRVVSP